METVGHIYDKLILAHVLCDSCRTKEAANVTLIEWAQVVVRIDLGYQKWLSKRSQNRRVDSVILRVIFMLKSIFGHVGVDMFVIKRTGRHGCDFCCSVGMFVTENVIQVLVVQGLQGRKFILQLYDLLWYKSDLGHLEDRYFSSIFIPCVDTRS